MAVRSSQWIGVGGMPILRHPQNPWRRQPYEFIAIPVDGEWRLSVVLICVSPVTDGVESLLMCFMSIHICSLVKCLLISLPICLSGFSVGLSVVLLSCTLNSLCILDMRFDIFSQYVSCPFIFLWCFLKSKYFRFWLSPVYQGFSSIDHAFDVICRKIFA